MNHPSKKRQYPFKRHFNRRVRRIVFMLVAAAIASGINYYNKHNTSDSQAEISHNANPHTLEKSNTESKEFSASEQQHAVDRIEAAKEKTNSRFWVGVNGTVIKRLKDDLKGSRHQKFLIKISPRTTLLISHNIDLAPYIPLNKGDRVSLYGRYEWNNRGGVIHWTHHDPKGKKKGGWIRLNDKLYR